MITELKTGEGNAEKVKKYRNELYEFCDRSRRIFNANKREWREEYYMPSGTVVSVYPHEDHVTFITTNQIGRTERIVTYRIP